MDETGCANPTALAADESVVVDGVGADATGGTKGELDGGWDGWEAWDVDGGVEVSSNGIGQREEWWRLGAGRWTGCSTARSPSVRHSSNSE